MGSIFSSSFFILNKIFSESETYSIQAPIVDVYTTIGKRGRKNVNVEVELFNFNKDLLFPIEDEEKSGASNFGILEVSKGGFGFEIIRDRKLVY